MNGKHDPNHPFKRLDTPTASGVKVTERQGLRQIEARGIFVGAKVIRGPDWMWENQDGGEGGIGVVVNFSGLNKTPGRSIANVHWNKTEKTNVYRFGHRGKMDIRHVEAVSGGCFYKDHLPVVGEALNYADDSLNFKVGDKVKIELKEEVLKSMQEGHGGWNPLMAKCIGKIGTVHSITLQGDVKVQYEGFANPWRLHAAAIVKVSDSNITAGAKVLISENKTLVKELQNGHGEWVDEMSSCLGKIGKVLKIDSDGDLRIKVGGNTWTFNPACVTCVPGAPLEPVTEEDDLNPLLQLLLKMGMSDDLVAAAHDGNIEAVRRIVKEHPEKINDTNSEKTALQVASYQGYKGIVEVLLEFNANMELRDDDGDTALHYAAYGKEPEIMEILLKKGISINATNKKGSTALHVAVGKQSVTCVQILIKYNCNVNMQDSVMDTALHDAIGQDNLEIVDLLLGVETLNFSLSNKRGFNILHYAALRGHTLILEHILTKPNHLVNTKKEDGFTALHIVAINGHRLAAEALLVKGHCEINPKNKSDQTPLLLAVGQAKCSLVELLVDKGADVNAQDDDGDTALHIALLKNDLSKTTTKSTNDDAPAILEIAASLSSKKLGEIYLAIACFLAQNGADLEQKNQNGKSPIDIIEAPEVKEVVIYYASLKSNDTRPNRILRRRVSADPTTCVICSDEPATVSFEPCGHKMTCEECCIRVKKCISCKTLITKKNSPGSIPPVQHQLQKLTLENPEQLVAEPVERDVEAVDKISNKHPEKSYKSTAEHEDCTETCNTDQNTENDHSNRLVSQRIKVTIIGKKIGRNWRQLARLLEIPEDVIETTDIDQDRVQDKAEAMVTYWQKTKGNGATQGLLIENLQLLDCNDLVDEILALPKSSFDDLPQNASHNTVNHSTGQIKPIDRSSGSEQDLPKEQGAFADSKYPARVEKLLNMPVASKEIQLMHSWNPDDCSVNISLSKHNKLTCCRKSGSKSTDCIRGRIGYSHGLHVWELQWNTLQRGSHAVVGVATNRAQLYSVGYMSLLGRDADSWGWDLKRHKLYHDVKHIQEVAYPSHLKLDEQFVVPDSFIVVLDMDEGTLSFVVGGRYLGVAFHNLGGKTLYPIVSTVWGDCKITMKYIGGLDPD